jgi:hypothetical protein
VPRGVTALESCRGGVPRGVTSLETCRGKEPRGVTSLESCRGGVPRGDNSLEICDWGGVSRGVNSLEASFLCGDGSALADEERSNCRSEDHLGRAVTFGTSFGDECSIGVLDWRKLLVPPTSFSCTLGSGSVIRTEST